MNEIIEQYFDLSEMSKHFDEVLHGFQLTLELALIAAVLALTCGLILALLRQLPGRGFLPVRFLSVAYIDVFRGIPALLIILLISGSLPYLPLPESIVIPRWLGKPDPFCYGVMSLTIVYGAYMAEVYRAGIEAVPGGQMEAARSLGMSHWQAMRHVVVPQAVTLIPAPMLNEMISLLKDSTLVSVIAFAESVLISRELLAQSFNSSALMLTGAFFILIILPLARVVDRLIARNQGRITRGSHIEVA